MFILLNYIDLDHKTILCAKISKSDVQYFCIHDYFKMFKIINILTCNSFEVSTKGAHKSGKIHNLELKKG